MTREEYNKILGTKEKPETEVQLCGWDDCKLCINLRIRNKMPLPVLKRGESPKYHRYIDPSIKSTGYVRKSLQVNK